MGPHEMLHVCLQDGDTALHCAVSTDNIEDVKTRVSICKLLLEGKANPDVPDEVS